MGTHVLLEAAKEHGVSRFVHVSTDEVYGEGVQNEERAMLEESVLEPTNPYAATKAAAEFLVKAYHRSFQVSFLIMNDYYFYLYATTLTIDFYICYFWLDDCYYFSCR
jgi:UDP-glucose 4,6-dehydratase